MHPRARGNPTLPPGQPQVRFNIPYGLRLRRGEYPREVEWKQGDLVFTVDLLTGKRTVAFSDQPHHGKPNEKFRVIATSKLLPNVRKIDIGESDVHISQQGIDFRPSTTLNSYLERRRQDRNSFGKQRARMS